MISDFKHTSLCPGCLERLWSWLLYVETTSRHTRRSLSLYLGNRFSFVEEWVLWSWKSVPKSSIAYGLFCEIIYKEKMNFSRSRDPYSRYFFFEPRMVSCTCVPIVSCPSLSRIPCWFADANSFSTTKRDCWFVSRRNPWQLDLTDQLSYCRRIGQQLLETPCCPPEHVHSTGGCGKGFMSYCNYSWTKRACLHGRAWRPTRVWHTAWWEWMIMLHLTSKSH
jgi:hypothetical protein